MKHKSNIDKHGDCALCGGGWYREIIGFVHASLDPDGRPLYEPERLEIDRYVSEWTCEGCGAEPFEVQQ